jgi:dihydropteroate synthase
MAMIWRFGEHEVAVGAGDRAVLMGILNVTPDSFSDGGLFVDVDAAVTAGLRMVQEGAAIIDVGGESTRPGAQRVAAAEQIRRVLPVIERLRGECDALISIDTTLSEVAKSAVQAGARIINDVAAGTEDSRLLELAAQRGCGLILMHRTVKPQDDSYSDQYDQPPAYDDVVEMVRAFLMSRCEAATAAGVRRESIVIDPGLGFGKSVEQNYELVRRMGAFSATGYPVLCAASRKSFIGAATGVNEPAGRVMGSVAAAVAAYMTGVRLFRVHDVAAHREALAVAQWLKVHG